MWSRLNTLEYITIVVVVVDTIGCVEGGFELQVVNGFG
jgi:hypothetical protein